MVIFATASALMLFWVIVPAVVALAITIGAVTEISRATPHTSAAA
jgi:ABC-type long-subunit fatty acid transport system fused permease/ATPase subunit